MIVSDWLGADNTLGIDIWHRKYQRNNEDFEQWLDRVSAGDEEVKQLIREKKFLFGGRILANRGLTGKRITYSNCYVITPPEDNLESIYETCGKLARTYSTGGGCGIDISNLAPRGAHVNNAADTSSGAVSFMDTFSQVTGQIGQGGRRGALMISLRDNHPDLEEFLDCKLDLSKVNYANTSVMVSDAFMEAVEAGDDWELRFTRQETGEQISKVVKARDIFHKLAENNWRMGEPGCLFWSRISNYNLVSNDLGFAYAGTNPCLTGDTLISTTSGEIPIKDLVGKTPQVYCMRSDGNLVVRLATKVWLTRKKAQIVEVVTARGNLKCTPDHLIHTRNRGWVAASQLRKGDKITGLNRQMKDETHVSVGLSGGRYIPEHRLVASAYYDITNKDIHHINGDTLDNRIENLEVLSHSEHSRLTNTGRSIEVVRDELGRYVEKPVKAKRFSFNLKCGVGTNWVVQEVRWLETHEDVYDMTVPLVHNFVANRMVVHNCAEEPLPAGGSCLLGSINLSEFIKDGDFDFTGFIGVVRIAVRALNKVLDEGQPKHPLVEQRDSVRDWRQIGLGVMGIADLLIKLGIRYGSEEAIDYCDAIGEVMAVAAIDESCRLAEQFGAYPRCSANAVLESEYCMRHTTGTMVARIGQYGLRNSQLLTIAPTGTLSTMLGISGGIEPIFATHYTRTTKSLHGKDVTYKVYTPVIKQWIDEHGTEELPDYIVTAQTLDFHERIKMQAVWQKHIDAAISSTVNVPNNFTVEQTEELYMEAWKAGLKGITMFRDGCERAAILNTGNTKTEEVGLKRGEIEPTSDKLIGRKAKLTTGCGSLHVAAYFDPDTKDLKEIYLAKGSTGGCLNFANGLSRMISLSARAGVSITDIVEQLKSAGTCPSYAVRRATKGDTSLGSCCPVAIANALMDMWADVKGTPTAAAEQASSGAKCPQCGGELVHEMGCVTCVNCGYSKCG